MNVVSDTPAWRRWQEPGHVARGGYALALMAALAVHAAVIFGGPQGRPPGVEAVESSIEVSLVAAPPAEEVLPPLVPAPVAPELPPETMVREPEPPPLSPRIPRSKAPRPARASGDGRSAHPGGGATAARASAGAPSVGPSYLRNPHPAYPEEARRAGHHGTVLLLVQVSAEGRVLAAKVTRSSGHASLDERARSTVATRWTFRPAQSGGVPVASEVVIPVRFTLER